MRKIETIGFRLYDRWLRLKREEKTLEMFFVDNDYKEIAIYGMGLIGMQLYEELRFSGVKIRYAIDRDAAKKDIEGLEVITLEELQGEERRVDAIVVTPVQYYFEIERELLGLVQEIDIISVEWVVEYCR